MGQYYSILLIASVKGATTEERHDNEFQLCCAIHDWVKDDSLRIANESKNLILSAQTLKDVVESIFGPYPYDDGLADDEHYWDEDGDWHAIFHGSYGWENIMYQAFLIIGQYLEAGSYLSCYPDEGNWNLSVREDGSIVEGAEQDMDDESQPDKLDVMNDYFDCYETIVETDECDYYYPAQGDFSECFSTALTMYGSAHIINVSLDGCKEGEENIPLWSNGEWEDENDIYEAINKQKAARNQ